MNHVPSESTYIEGSEYKSETNVQIFIFLKY